MPIHPGAIRRDSSILARSVMWELDLQATAATDVFGAQAPGAAVLGPVLNFTSRFIRNPQSLFLTHASGTGNATYRLVGEDVHGNRIQEDITITGVATAHSTLCYRRLVSLEITASTLNGAMTISIGFSATAGVSIPMLAKGLAPGAILSVVHGTNGTAAPTATASAALSNIVLSGTVTAGKHRVYLDPIAAAWL